MPRKEIPTLETNTEILLTPKAKQTSDDLLEMSVFQNAQTTSICYTWYRACHDVSVKRTDELLTFGMTLRLRVCEYTVCRLIYILKYPHWGY